MQKSSPVLALMCGAPAGLSVVAVMTRAHSHRFKTVAAGARRSLACRARSRGAEIRNRHQTRREAR
jgi:hypothetical protein